MNKNFLVGLVLVSTSVFCLCLFAKITKTVKEHQQMNSNWNWSNNWNNSEVAAVPAVTTPLATNNVQLAAETYEEGLKLAAKEGKPVLLFFTANWCKYCKQMKEESFNDARVKSLMAHYVLVVVDTDKHPTVPQKYQVKGIPAYVIANHKGETLKSGQSYLKPANFAQWLDNPGLYNQPKTDEVAPPSVDMNEPEMPQEPEEPKHDERNRLRRQQPRHRQYFQQDGS